MDMSQPLSSSPLLRTRSVESSPPNNNHHHDTGSSSSNNSPVTRTRTPRHHPNDGNTKVSCLSTFRWVLLGIMIGSTATGFLQSLHLPSVCINLHVGGDDDNNSNHNKHHHSLEQMHLERLKAKKHKKKKKQQQQQEQEHHYNNTTKHSLQNLTDRSSSSSSSTTSSTTAKTATTVNTEEAPFVDLPPPPDLMHSDAFSACLLIKDDNHWLIEWLAYHYYVMPLRHLIVVIDPESKTSPRKILDRWSSRGLMDIRIWKDEDFMPKKITATADMFDNNTGLMMHRVRQNNFYRRCIPTLRNRKREWVMLVDTDEFVLPSYASGHFRNLTSQVSFQEGGSVMRLLRYHEMVVKDHNNTCVYMPRFFFGARDHPRKELVKYGIPHGIKAENMLTQRYLFREPRQNYNGKNLINTYRVPDLKVFGGVHHIATACPDPNVVRHRNQNKHALIRVHHYLGTQEQYLYRDDPRLHANNPTATNKTKFGSFNTRGIQRYEEYNRKANHEDHAAKAWIRGFVKEMGIEMAVNLLEGVGELEEVPNNDDDDEGEGEGEEGGEEGGEDW